jgi:hypothetical protein
VLRKCTQAKAWDKAAVLSRRLEPVIDPEQRPILLAFRRALSLRLLDQIPSSFESGLKAIEEIVTKAAYEPEIHHSAIAELLERVEKRIGAMPNSYDPSRCAREKAELIGKAIELLNRLFSSNAALAAAGEALAVLHIMRAVQLANGNRPADALLELENVEAYAPKFPELSTVRSQVESQLASARKALRDVLGQFGNRYSGGTGGTAYRTVLNAEGYAMSAQVETGTSLRDRFRSSAEPRKIRERVQNAQVLQLWLRAAIPPSQSGWTKKARSFDRATDLLMARQPKTAADLLTEWLTILAENKDLASDLSEVGPDHLLAHFTREQPGDAKDVDPASLVPKEDISWLERPSQYPNSELPVEPEPDFEPSASRTALDDSPAPQLAVSATMGNPLHEDVHPEFWIFSRRSLGLKMATVAAGLFLILAVGLAAVDSR